MSVSLPWLPTGGPRALQVKAGVACGLLAVALYAVRPSEVAVVPTTPVLALAKALPLGGKLTDSVLTTVAVPTTLAEDFLPDTPENRARIDHRATHVALDKGERITPAMFLGGLDHDIIADIPPGHRSAEIAVKALPAGVGPGTRVDVYGPRGPVVENALVIAVKPFTIAVPNAAALNLFAAKDLRVGALPDVDPGRVASLPAPVAPKRRAPAAPKGPQVILPTH